MSRRALVLGVTGQDGSYLAEFLLAKGYEVHGVVRRTSLSNTLRIDHLGDRLTLHYGDLSDGVSLRSIVTNVRPDEVYNLAAHSHVPASFRQPVYASLIDAVGVMTILETMRDERPGAKFYQASSSEMFGQVCETPQDENTVFHPRSPYGCAKVFGHWQTRNYREAYGMFACSGILFNHESERRGEGFVTRKITRAATRIKEGLQQKVALGNLDAARDWGYAPEYVEAMWLMLQQPVADDFVIATGETHTVREFAQEAFGLVGLDWQQHVVLDAACLRPAEVATLCGNAAKAKRVLGWEARTKFKDLVRIMVEADWRLAKQEKVIAGMQ